MRKLRQALSVHFAILGAALALLCASAVATAQKEAAPALTPEQLKRLFARPAAVPHPPDNPPSAAKVALGEQLFGEPRLSGNGRISCATCHDPLLGFADGQPISRAGATGAPLRRHTPPLWNLAWAPVLYWDGRAASLEAQARAPMSHPDEMAGSPEAAAAQLDANEAYRVAFRKAFPGTQSITGDLVLQALAAYERTLVSPPTRFDRWIAGDAAALTPEEQRGFALFTGKGQCVRCHSGFAFTDHAFHDIGLPGSDRGRGPIIGLAAAEHAFKTPGLRELAWTAPYMHDGGLATLEAVVRHYERGGVVRPGRSKDMPQPFQLVDEERADLVAFLESLSSDEAPKPSTEAWVGRVQKIEPAPSVAASRISQRDKMFSPAAIRVRRGEAITVLNDDTRTHNVRIAGGGIDYNSGAQEPGDNITFHLEKPGRYEAHCGIHPAMRLSIEVE
jgi:cytochrome c peroxidase